VFYESEMHPKNARGSKTSDEKRGTAVQKHTPKMQGAQSSPPIKKEASHFRNTLKNARGSE
jgi:hypothetical protein